MPVLSTTWQNRLLADDVGNQFVNEVAASLSIRGLSAPESPFKESQITTKELTWLMAWTANYKKLKQNFFCLKLSELSWPLNWIISVLLTKSVVLNVVKLVSNLLFHIVDNDKPFVTQKTNKCIYCNWLIDWY